MENNFARDQLFNLAFDAYLTELENIEDADMLPPVEDEAYFSAALEELVQWEQEMGLYEPPFDNPLVK